LPMPAWGIAVMVIGMDLFGAMGIGEKGIAFSVHLAGAAFAIMYYNYGWNFGRTWERLVSYIWKPRPKKSRFSVFHPNEDVTSKKKTEEEILGEKVDEILKKYSRHGEAGLTSEEREILKKAGNAYQKKHKR